MFRAGDVFIVSGTALISHDEMMLVAGFRAVKQQQAGELYVKLAGGTVTVFSCKPDYGSAQALNAAMGRLDYRDEE